MAHRLRRGSVGALLRMRCGAAWQRSGGPAVQACSCPCCLPTPALQARLQQMCEALRGAGFSCWACTACRLQGPLTCAAALPGASRARCLTRPPACLPIAPAPCSACMCSAARSVFWTGYHPFQTGVHYTLEVRAALRRQAAPLAGGSSRPARLGAALAARGLRELVLAAVRKRVHRPCGPGSRAGSAAQCRAPLRERKLPFPAPALQTDMPEENYPQMALPKPYKRPSERANTIANLAQIAQAAGACVCCHVRYRRGRWQQLVAPSVPLPGYETVHKGQLHLPRPAFL